MIIIGITGTIGAGKGTVVEYLVSKNNFVSFSVGDYLKERLRAKGLEPNRDNMRIIANEIRKKHGPDYIVKELFKRSLKQAKNTIIESIRNPKEAEFIKKQNNSYLLSVDAKPKIRYARIQKRNELKDKVSYREFLNQEKREMNSKDPNAQNLNYCMSVADFKTDNSGDLKSLYKQIDKILKKIK